MPSELIGKLEDAPTPQSGQPSALLEHAASGSITQRVDAEILSQYRYPPKVPSITSVTSTARQMTDGGTVADIEVTFPVNRELVFDVQLQQSGQNPELYSDLRSSPFKVYAKPTNIAFLVSLRARHPVSGFASAFSAATSYTTAKDTTAPATPTSPSATLRSDGTGVTVAWADNTEADLAQYEVWRATSSGSEAKYATVRASAFTDVDVVLGTTYYYKIKAVDQTGNASALSSEVSGTIPFTGSFGVSSPAFRQTPVNPTDGGAWTSLTAAGTITIPAGSAGKTLNIGVTIYQDALNGSPNLTVRIMVGSTAGTASASIGAGSASGTALSLVLSNIPSGIVGSSQTLTIQVSDSGANNTSTFSGATESTAVIS